MHTRTYIYIYIHTYTYLHIFIHIYIIHTFTHTHSFENRIGKSNIDLTLVTNNLVRRITDWKISDEESNSDYSIISYDIKLT